MMKEMDALEIGEPRFFDITDPWLYSPEAVTLASTSEAVRVVRARGSCRRRREHHAA